MEENAQRWSIVYRRGSSCRAEEGLQTHLQAIRQQAIQAAGTQYLPASPDLQAIVQLFQCRSGLISMARNVSYAPLLLENHPSLSPFERFKNILVLQISMALLALSTRSPFNPVIGETYQGSIHGCPIFMEQISHHPAITYLLF